MRTNLRIAAICLCIIGTKQAAEAEFDGQQMVVANRAAGNISVIDVDSNRVTNIDLPTATNAATPGYVVYSPLTDTVFVGDSANARIVAFDARTYNVVDPAIPVGNGAFHMWGNTVHNQLWVTNPTDQTVSVIDMLSRNPLMTISSPIVAGTSTTPHDVVLDPHDGSAFVTYFADEADLVVRYSPLTFVETGRREVAEDPHVAVSDKNNALYVATQDGGQVEIIDQATVTTAAPSIPVVNAHGLAMTSDSSTLFVSSFPGPSGVAGLHAIDTATNALVNSVDAPAAGNGPHNLAVSADNSRLYATHTGGSSSVSIFDISDAHSQQPMFIKSIQTDANPFGLAAVPAVPEPTGGILWSLALIFAASRRRS